MLLDVRPFRSATTGVNSTGTGLFAGGATPTHVATTDKFAAATGVFTLGTNLSNARSITSAWGTGTTVYPAGGLNGSGIVTQVEKYVLATDSVSNGGVLDGSADWRTNGCINNASVGIIGSQGVTKKYNFSTDAVTTGTAIIDGGNEQVGISGPVFGVIGSGVISANELRTNKYTYATDATVESSMLISQKRRGAGGANSTVGVMAGSSTTGTGQLVNKYTFSTETFASATSLSSDRGQPGGSGYPDFALFAGGAGPLTATSEKYVFATDTLSTGASLSLARSAIGSSSNSHGGL